VSAIKADICIIGAGSGGLSLAAGAAQMGARVVLIEAGEMGGDCLNVGCVPSKALLAAAAKGMGWKAAHDHVRAAIATIAPHDSVARFEGLGVTVLKGFARFTGPRTVVVEGTELRARRFVIATGSRPAVPAIPGLDSVPFLTNETLFDLADAPESLLILGGGPVGVEMALAHRRLGCAVTLLEAGTVLGREDPEAAALVVAALRTEGVRVEEGAAVASAARAAHGVTLTLADGRTFSGAQLLVAAGRAAAVDGLGLDAAGVATSPKGIVVDAGLRTTNRRIFALGDVTGSAGFTHEAGYQAGLLARRLLFGLPARTGTPMPRVTYTEPELAQVGLTEAEARAAHGDRLTVIREDFAANDRAVTAGQKDGFLKLMVLRGRPIGATMVGPQAGELIGLWSLAISRRMKLSAIAGVVLPYPTRSEISRRAAGTYFSSRLFDNQNVKRVVRAVQTLLP
jgi:pyruvate/2-oxoglutarate dehydrogenase complex dihydrolipoamide dehydrogenase (E3) component